MGNQCHENNTSQTQFNDFNVKKYKQQYQQQKNQINQNKHINEQINKFLQINQKEFNNSEGRVILSCISITDMYSHIKKYTQKYVIFDKSIWLEQNSVTNIENYSGEAMIFDNKSKIFYVGSINKLQKQGKGLLINEKGNKYMGSFSQDNICRQGELKLLYPKRKYKGYWLNGNLEGQGEIFYEDGAHYKGNLIKGKKQKEGVLIFRDGSVYKGSFKADLMHGQGVFVKFKGKQIHGEWKEGKFNKSLLERTSYTGSINEVASF